MKAFTSAAAQFDNLGDLVLRRTLVHRLAEHSEVHVHLGDADASYVEALQLPAGSTAYPSYATWSRALLAAGRSAALVYAPGEQRLGSSPRELVRAATHLAASTAVRARGGRVAKVGRGYATVTGPGLWMERRALALCHLAVLRDHGSAALADRPYCPDVALDWRVPRTGLGRPGVGVSLRADRPADAALLTASRQVLRAAGPLTVATQVRRDDDSAAVWAERLGADLLAWGDRSHLAQLRAVCELYQSSRYVVSDRLHVLYFALANGAVPVALAGLPGAKVEQGLTSLGLGDLVVRSPAELAQVLDGDLGVAQARCLRALCEARGLLRQTWADLAALGSEPARAAAPTATPPAAPPGAPTATPPATPPGAPSLSPADTPAGSTPTVPAARVAVTPAQEARR